MKKILLTAAALTLGTSAFAWTDAHEGMHGADQAQASVVPAIFAGWTDPSVASGEKGDMEAETFADADIKSKAAVGGVMAASAESFAAKDMEAAKTDTDGLTWAEADIKSKAMVGGIDATVGMGGPIEPQGYPACRPGRGDDNCIQLYERGVRDELAAYKASDGPTIGMGGPFEPAADAKPAGPAAAAGDTGPKVPDDEGEAAAEKTDAAPDPHAGHDMNGTKPAASPTPSGVGGPIEARTDYPACSRTVTDSCIQSR